MVNIYVDGANFFVESNVSVLEACQLAGAKIPRFCYNESLSVAGNCRMCLVEIANTLKPVASCALPVSNGLKIFTRSPLVKKARENILELLLINHPLDCPICDQGGECDLQDQSRQFGADFSRYHFSKRVVEDKALGPLIKTIMTRCIHCTRCVRFNTQVSDNEFLGTLNRGVLTEIGSYATSFFNSQMSGNVIDLCPVGALTSKAYSFKARPWELRTNESIELTDGLSCSIYISSKESEVVRIFPKVTSDIREPYISDKSRFYFDSNKNNRLLAAETRTLFDRNDLIKRGVLDIERPRTLFLSNDNSDIDTLLLLKTLENLPLKSGRASLFTKKVGCSTVIRLNLFNSWIKGSLLNITNNACLFFLISCDLSLENSILNTKIRNKSLASNVNIFGFGKNFGANFDLKLLNLSLTKFYTFFEAKFLEISSFFFRSKETIFLISEDLFRRGLSFDFFYLFVKTIVSKVELIKIQNAVNAEGSCFLNHSKSNTRVIHFVKHLFCLNLEESFLLKKYFLRKLIAIVWFSTHNSEILQKSLIPVIYYFPIPTEFEQSKAFVNFEEKIQKTGRGSYSSNSSLITKQKLLEMFKINKRIITNHISFYTEMLNSPGHFSNLNFSKLFFVPMLKALLQISRSSFYVSSYPIKKLSEDFYLSNKMLKNSKVMQYSAQKFRKMSSNFLLTKARTLSTSAEITAVGFVESEAPYKSLIYFMNQDKKVNCCPPEIQVRLDADTYQRIYKKTFEPGTEETELIIIFHKMSELGRNYAFKDIEIRCTRRQKRMLLNMAADLHLPVRWGYRIQLYRCHVDLVIR